MLERVGTAVAILTGWRHSGSHPREWLDGTRFSLERERNETTVNPTIHHLGSKMLKVL